MGHSDSTADGTSGKLISLGTTAFSGITTEILLGGEHASMTVMAMNIAPGHGAPAHISFSEDKVFQIIEGRMIFLVGDMRLCVSAGDTLFVAQGVTHSFSALDGFVTRMMLVATPARHDRFFRAMNDLPLPHDLDDVQAVCARFDQAIVGPVVSC